MPRSLVVVSLVFAACSIGGNNTAPPLTQLYFPTGLVHVDAPGKTEGVLFVANSNFDKRYGTGSLDAIALDDVGLPPLGGAAADPVALGDLKLGASQSVQIASFSGELAAFPVNGGNYRLYVPTRSEGMRVYQVSANLTGGVPSLSCLGGGDGQNCTAFGASLSPKEFEQSTAGVPRAPSPYGVAVARRACSTAGDCCASGVTDCGRTCAANLCLDGAGEPFGDVWFTHLTQADSPNQSLTNYRAYLARLDSDTFSVDASNFIEIGAGGTNSLVAKSGWVYASGRVLSPAPNLLRIVNRAGTVLSSSLESYFRVADSRSVALSGDGKRLYLVGRSPDTLLVLKLNDPDSAAPSLSFVRGVSLPDAPNQVAVISRAGKGDLVAVSATSGSSVALYDDDVGELVALVPNLGVQPYGLAVDHRGNAARLFVSLFGDGRIAVIDVPNLDRPQDARLVAHLGDSQLCLTRGLTSPACLALDGGTP